MSLSRVRCNRKSQVLQQAGKSSNCSFERPHTTGRHPPSVLPAVLGKPDGSAGLPFTFSLILLPPPLPVDERGRGGGGDEPGDGQRDEQSLLPAVRSDGHVACWRRRKTEVSRTAREINKTKQKHVRP